MDLTRLVVEGSVLLTKATILPILAKAYRDVTLDLLPNNGGKAQKTLITNVTGKKNGVNEFTDVTIEGEVQYNELPHAISLYGITGPIEKLVGEVKFTYQLSPIASLDDEA